MQAEANEDPLYDAAYDAIDDGRLDEAVGLFSLLIAREPDNVAFHYMLGLAHKYRFDWPASLASNLRAIELREQPNEAEVWNAAIAATGAGDWATARRCWALAGINIPGGEGPIVANFGSACLRLNAWGEGETLWAQRIDPCRARIDNVPYPKSGYRFGDIVLHDGASTGERLAQGSRYPVFNVFQRTERSIFDTFEVELSCEDEDALESLLEAHRPGIGLLEDWTASVRPLCRSCSLGLPHEHDDAKPEWTPQRYLGVAAQSAQAVRKLVTDWAAAGPGRRLEGLAAHSPEPMAPPQASAWWRGAEEDEP